MTEVLYWTVVEIKPPVLDQLELFFLNNHIPSCLFLLLLLCLDFLLILFC